MIRNSFCHVPKVGAGTERRLWEAGITDWKDVLDGRADSILGSRAAWVRELLAESEERLAAGDADWFAQGLPPCEAWRLYPDFMDKAAFVDIETTGLGMDVDHITTIALHGRGEVRTYARHENLDDFQDDIRDFDLLVTFNGKCFDAPFIERSFKIKLPKAHVDLRYVLKKLGYSGGLKRIEKELGLSRDGVEGVDGYFAVLLWREFRRTGDRAALDTLLAYNAMDAVNLEPLMVHAVNSLSRELPLPVSSIPAPAPPQVPHQADQALVARMKARYGII